MMSVEILPDDDLGDMDWLCKFWGGAESPVHQATIYRWIKAGRIPGLIQVGPQAVRCSKTQHRLARQRMIDGKAA